MSRRSMRDLIRGIGKGLRSPAALLGRRPPTTVQGFWYGEPLAPLHRACLHSFIGKGVGFDLYAYQDLAVPPGVRLRDAGEIVPKEEMFFFANPHTRQPDVAPFVDYFRLILLRERGGWWCDVDTICLTADLPEGDRIWARPSPEYRPDSVSNGQLHFKRNDALLATLIDEARQRKDSLTRRESLGPELFTSVINRLNLPLDLGATADTFYPIRFIESFKLWLPEFRAEVESRIADAVFLPVFQSFPTRFGISTQKLPPKQSYLGRFVKRYAPEVDAPAYDADTFRTLVRAWFKANPNFLPQLRSVSRPGIDAWLKGTTVTGRKGAARRARRQKGARSADEVAT